MNRFSSALLGCLAALVLLSACAGGPATSSAPGDTAAPVASAGSGDYDVHRNLSYGGSGKYGTYDLYVPSEVDAATPLVVFIHGGSWSDGTKEYYTFVGRGLASRGVIAAVTNYRLYPEVKFPGFVEDSAKATANIARAMRRGGNGVPAGKHPLFVMGHSAGAQIAALVALDGRYLRAEGFSTGQIRGFIGLSGPYDFLPIPWERYRRIFPEEILNDSQPVNFVHRGEPPALLLHGLSDSLVKPENSRSLEARMRAAGASVEAEYYPGVTHIGTVTPFGGGLLGNGAIPERVVAFIRSRS